jgi:Ras-related protein Rab-32
VKRDVRRYTEDNFTPNYKLTIGVDFALKHVVHDGQKISLQLWDIAGHERFGHMTHVYYKYAIAAILVFDLGRPATFEAIATWQKDLNEKVMLANEEPVPMIILANKVDLSENEIDKEKLDAYCEDNRFEGWYATSAKTNKNIDEAMEFLITKILEVAAANQQPIQPKSANLTIPTKGTTKSKLKCCEGF